ncbi:MAG: hypothetical protein BWY77_01626 [bacterium ADurb.Bin431]|nr:MAG: hypothetical protein BWY77_01626 [bacterium ADurb.Bin431]
MIAGQIVRLGRLEQLQGRAGGKGGKTSVLEKFLEVGTAAVQRIYPQSEGGAGVVGQAELMDELGGAAFEPFFHEPDRMSIGFAEVFGGIGGRVGQDIFFEKLGSILVDPEGSLGEGGVGLVGLVGLVDFGIHVPLAGAQDGIDKTGSTLAASLMGLAHGLIDGGKVGGMLEE